MSELTFEPTERQFEAWEFLSDQVTTSIGYGGAAAGGKSWLGCNWITLMCYAYPGTRWFIGRKEQTNLQKTTLVTLFKVFERYGIRPDIDFSFDKKLNIIHFKVTKSEILLLDLAYKPSDPLYTRLGGLEVTGGFIDESNEIEYAAIDVVGTRIGRWRNEEYGILGKILETFNPSKNHVYTRFYQPFKDNSLPSYVRFIRSLPTDNPYTPSAYLEQLRHSDPITRQRLLEGNFEYDEDENALFSFDDIQNLFTNSINTDGQEYYITVDVARFGKDRTIIMTWKGLEVIDIEIIDKSDLSYVEDRVEQKRQQFGVKLLNVIADEDGVGGGVVDHLKCRGFVANSSPVENANPHYKVNFQNLKSQCYYALAELTQQGKIRIMTDRVFVKEAIAEELEQIKRKDSDKDGKLKVIGKDEIKDTLGHSPDFADTLMMRMFFVVQPIYRVKVFAQKPAGF